MREGRIGKSPLSSADFLNVPTQLVCMHHTCVHLLHTYLPGFRVYPNPKTLNADVFIYLITQPPSSKEFL